MAAEPRDIRLLGCVLLAEDGLDNGKLISLVLENAGLEVVLAENGRVAVELGERAERFGEAFDVVLMVLDMPEPDGPDATREFRRRG